MSSRFLSQLGSALPGLLVSVRNGREADEALAGGASVIDVKEPLAGALGAADPRVLTEVVNVVAGRVPVTAAAGELRDWMTAEHSDWRAPPGVELVKLGLAGCQHIAQWPELWEQTFQRIRGTARLVAVVYADWRTAATPEPEQIRLLAARYGCPAILVDTFDKTAGSLFDHWPEDSLTSFVARARQTGTAVVLAGSLSGQSYCRAVRLQPELVAVRGAACESGRDGHVVSGRVRELRNLLNLNQSALTSAATEAPLAEC